MASQQINDCVVCMKIFDGSTNIKPKILPNCGHSMCLRCLKKLVARARNKVENEMNCPKCKETYNITDEEADKMFKDNYALKDMIEMGDLNEEELNLRLETNQKLKEDKEKKLEKLKREKDAETKEIEIKKKLVEESRNEQEVAKQEVDQIKPNLEETKEKWETAKEATEKAESGVKEAKENLKDWENTFERAIEQFELAVKAKDDALKAKEKADLIRQHNEGSYASIKQHYEAVSEEYENSKPQYEKVINEAKLKEENLKKVGNEVKKCEENLERVEKEIKSVEYNIKEIGLVIRQVELEKEKIEMKRQKPESMEENKDQVKVSPTDYKNKQIEKVVAEVEPCGVTVSPNGNILVICGNHTVTTLSPQGERRCVGKWGSGQGEFRYPYDVTTNNRDEMFISDIGNKRVEILDTLGRFLRNIIVDNYPVGICLDEDENLYATTYSPHQIIKYNRDGNEVKRMTSDKFVELQHLVHHQGKLYVADLDANLIHVVTTELEYVGSIGGGVVTEPIAITIDKHNTLLVTVRPSGIVALTLDGELVAKIAEENIKSATGITTDLKGKIIVCDWGNRRVVKL